MDENSLEKSFKRQKTRDGKERARGARTSRRASCAPAIVGPEHSPSRSPTRSIEIPLPEDLDSVLRIYERDDDYFEDERLEVSGESVPEGDDGPHSSKPVRVLGDFTFYSLDTLEIIPFSEVSCLPPTPGGYNLCEGPIGASGTVSALFEDEDSDEEDGDEDDSHDSRRVKLGEILALSVFWVDGKTKDVDDRIYVETAHAWYTLEIPSQEYRSFYESYYISHILTHAIIWDCSINRRLTLQGFMGYLSTLSHEYDVEEVIGRDLDAADLPVGLRVRISCAIQDLVEGNEIPERILRVPLYIQLTTESDEFMAAVTILIDDDPDPYGLSTNKPHHSKRKRLKAKSNTLAVVTPNVGRLAQPLFRHHLEIVGIDKYEGYFIPDMPVDPPQHINNSVVVLEDPLPDTSDHVEACFGRAIIDGVIYKPGDYVTVGAGGDEDDVRTKNSTTAAAQSVNTLANIVWFIQIHYIYQLRSKKYFHGQWLAHGSKTILQELAHPNELYLLDGCDDLELDTILGKANVKRLPIGTNVPPVNTVTENTNFFFLKWMWLERRTQTESLPTDAELEAVTNDIPGNKRCYQCKLTEQETLRQQVSIVPSGFSYQGRQYHLNDTIYVKPSPSGPDNLVYRLAQIVGFASLRSQSSISVREFIRRDDFLKKAYPNSLFEQARSPQHIIEPRDERRLVYTERISNVSARDVDGHFWIKSLDSADEIEQWTVPEDHFYVRDMRDGRNLVPLPTKMLKNCTKCLLARQRALDEHAEFLATVPKWECEDLFAGCGGLTLGLEMTGHIETVTAIEQWPSATKTFRLNNPDASVICQDISVVLRDQIHRAEGKAPKHIVDLETGRKISKDPRRKPKLLAGCPPCQPFSGANHLKDPNDPRTTLIATMFSKIEHEQPDMVLLENVTGMLNYPLMSERQGHKLVGGYDQGIPKLIYALAGALGYKVQIAVVQAASSGCPQTRKRLAAALTKDGYGSPRFPPDPTHGVPSMTYKLATGFTLPSATRSLDPDYMHSYAPHRAVTIEDAISDLPAFGWENPNLTTKKRKLHKAVLPTDLFNATPRQGSALHPGFPKTVAYLTPQPLNRFQATMRRNKDNEFLSETTYHHTSRFTPIIIERVCNIPVGSREDHLALPAILQATRTGNSQRKTVHERGKYGRLHPSQQFMTVRTTSSPMRKGAWTLHPMQPRNYSIREMARAQTFPDYYCFESTEKIPSKILTDQYHQIGNAVPPLLGLAIGNTIVATRFQEWKIEKSKEKLKARELSPEV